MCMRKIDNFKPLAKILLALFSNRKVCSSLLMGLKQGPWHERAHVHEVLNEHEDFPLAVDNREITDTMEKLDLHPDISKIQSNKSSRRRGVQQPLKSQRLYSRRISSFEA